MEFPDTTDKSSLGACTWCSWVPGARGVTRLMDDPVNAFRPADTIFIINRPVALVSGHMHKILEAEAPIRLVESNK
jgi:hypothetical protein